jgi:hypothetical protein
MSTETTKPVLAPFRFLGVCRGCGRSLFENNRVLLKGRHLYCGACGGTGSQPHPRRSFWQWLWS